MLEGTGFKTDGPVCFGIGGLEGDFLWRHGDTLVALPFNQDGSSSDSFYSQHNLCWNLGEDL